MAWYAVNCSLLFMLSLTFAVTGRHDIAAAVFVLPLAHEWALGRRGHAQGLAAAAVVAGVLFTGRLLNAGDYFVAVAAGVLMGEGFWRGWTFGRITRTLTAVGFVLIAANMVLNWQDLRHQATIFSNSLIAMFEESPNAGASEVMVVVEQLKWMDVHWAEVAFGSLFAAMLWLTVGAVALLTLAVRTRVPRGGPSTGFGEMRTPEWLVWVAILTALLWFVEQRWPNAPLRMLTWNTALALSSVYSLNGLSVLVHALKVFRTPMWIAVSVTVAMVFTGVSTLLGPVGLFDTWWDVRGKLDQFVAAREGTPSSRPM